MTKKEFQELTAKRVIYLDGATGTSLSKAGMPAGVCPEQWVLEHPQVLVQLQRGYIRAGSDILYAPTFSANGVKLREYGIYDQMEDMIRKLVGLSKQVITQEQESLTASSQNHQTGQGCGEYRRVYLAGDLTMTGELLVPLGKMEFEELVDLYKEQILYLVKAGVDLLVVETMMSLGEARAALLAAREVCDLPVMVTMTFQADGRTMFGTDGETAAVVLESLGASAIGANCSTGPKEMESVIRSMASVTSIPIIAKPNAGLPKVNERGETYYDMSAETFAAQMIGLTQVGASMLGGCCGTDPQYIQTLRETIKAREANEAGEAAVRRQPGKYYLSSERKTLSFDLDGSFFLIGERINPTGKKKLQGELREGSMEMVRRFACEQEEMGALVLDVNMGMSGVSEEELMLRAIQEVGEVSDLPLSLDSSSPQVLESALRHYHGRALVNSVSLEREKMEKLLPIVAKYGAMFILLPLSDKGLPENLKEKQSIIQKVSSRAYELGMRKEDIIVDGLVTTIGANKKAALETLETIRWCRDEQLATVCGLSNISFGMPNRTYINAAFLTLAIGAGLTMAIANPSQVFMKGMSLGTDLLLGKDGADLRYIEQVQSLTEETPRSEGNKTVQTAAAREAAVVQIATARETAVVQTVTAKETATVRATAQSESEETRFLSLLEASILKGNRNGIQELTKQALDAQISPERILQEALLPAIRQVGEWFEKGKYFLPQLIASAETMKLAVALLEPLLTNDMDDAAGNKPVVIIATVEGDIHDIGKNLVALLLKNNGFQVIDLGKDVKAETIAESASAHHAAVIALSALMTTTMHRMKEVIACVRAKGIDAKIIIGGAVVTKGYAKEIGADGYSQDAAGAVRLVEELTKTGETARTVRLADELTKTSETAGKVRLADELTKTGETADRGRFT
jgi:5-methyltetrahydrofolate--homocysteine methyltransferase